MSNHENADNVELKKKIIASLKRHVRRVRKELNDCREELKNCTAEKTKNYMDYQGQLNILKKALGEAIKKVQKCTVLNKKLLEMVEEILPLAIPPYEPAVFVGLSEFPDPYEKRWDDIVKRLTALENRDQAGSDQESEISPDQMILRCWLMSMAGAMFLGTVNNKLGPTLKPGQLVLLSRGAVIGSIPGGEIRELKSVCEGKVESVSSNIIIVNDGKGYQGRGVVYSPELKEELSAKPLENGDTVLLFGPCILSVLKRHEEIITTKKNVVQANFSQLGGLGPQIQEIKDVLGFGFDPLDWEAMGKEIPRGVTLYGPPGCGKTRLVAALSREYQYYLQVLNGAEITDKFVGETPRKMRESFDLAFKNKPAIWFIDEAESLFPVRGSSISAEHKTDYLSQFDVIVDGIEDTRGVFVILATNRIDQLDPAATRPGRCERKIFFPRPNHEGVIDILRIYFGRSPVAESGDRKEIIERWIKNIADEIFIQNKSTRLFTAWRGNVNKDYYLKDFVSGAIVKAIVDEISLDALKRLQKSGIKKDDSKFGIIGEDLKGKAVAAIRRDVPKDQVTRNQWLLINGYKEADEFR